jgi:hypothetical protein
LPRQLGRIAIAAAMVESAEFAVDRNIQHSHHLAGARLAPEIFAKLRIGRQLAGRDHHNAPGARLDRFTAAVGARLAGAVGEAVKHCRRIARFSLSKFVEDERRIGGAGRCAF